MTTVQNVSKPYRKAAIIAVAVSPRAITMMTKPTVYRDCRIVFISLLGCSGSAGRGHKARLGWTWNRRVGIGLCSRSCVMGSFQGIHNAIDELSGLLTYRYEVCQDITNLGLGIARDRAIDVDRDAGFAHGLTCTTMSSR
jgi:hypothetical protein